jgi:hypothetical protein
LNTVLTAVDTLYVNGTAYKKADLVAEFQKRLTAAQATAAARSALMTCTANEATIAAEVDPLRGGTKIFLKSYYGKKSPTLQQFGFTPDRTPVVSAATRAAAVAKTKATKEARGETGKKAKAAITAPATTTPAPAAAEPATPVAAPAAKP